MASRFNRKDTNEGIPAIPPAQKSICLLLVCSDDVCYRFRLSPMKGTLSGAIPVVNAHENALPSPPEFGVRTCARR